MIVREDPSIGIDSVSTMDEIALDIDGDLDDAPFVDEDEAFEDEDELDKDDAEKPAEDEGILDEEE